LILYFQACFCKIFRTLIQEQPTISWCFLQQHHKVTLSYHHNAELSNHTQSSKGLKSTHLSLIPYFHSKPWQRKSPPPYIIARLLKQLLCSYPNHSLHIPSKLFSKTDYILFFEFLGRFFHSSASHLGRPRRCRIARGIGPRRRFLQFFLSLFYHYSVQIGSFSYSCNPVLKSREGLGRKE